jgi:enoyl-CoA hydratase/carnithine racemase
MTDRVVRFTTERHVGWLEFNRPPVNVFTCEMVDELHDAIQSALGDPAVRSLWWRAPSRAISAPAPISTSSRA